MAEALNHVDRKRITKIVETKQIKLNLSIEEAQTLVDVMSFIGGDPWYSRRRHTQAVATALQSTGLKYGSNLDIRGPSLYFNDGNDG